jgi:DNA-binding CsgD family transcriptional regulator
MSKSNGLRLSDMLSVMRHLADVASVKGDPQAQRQLLVDGLNEVLGTNQGFLFACDEWRPELKPHFVHQTLSKSCDTTFLRYAAEFGIAFPLRADPYCDFSLGDRRQTQMWTMDDVYGGPRADPRRYPEFAEIQQSGRVRDGFVTMFRTGENGDRVVGLGMHQFGAERKLKSRQIALAAFALDEVRRLIDRGHLALPPMPPRPLPARLQQVLDRLLVGHAPKAIARELGLSIHTVREHVQRLYRTLGVGGRDELMARFVRPSADAPSQAHP